MNNIQTSLHIIQELYKKGVDTFCICPSSRNAPLVEVLTRSKGLTLFQFFDERSSAFFALGRSQRTENPIAVVTTSGTAVCELLSAVCTAYYSPAVLVLLTADRPLDYQGTGAPQCIDQTGLFSKYISQEWDISVGQHLDLSSWNTESSIHINVRIDEPLIDNPQFLEDYKKNSNFYKDQDLQDLSKNTFHSSSKISSSKKFKPAFSNIENVKTFFKKSKKPLVLVGGLPIVMQKQVESFLLKLNAPIYAEPLSQLRESHGLQHLILQSGESILQQAFQEKWMDGILRIGAVPTVRFWRDLNDLHNFCVCSLSLSSFSGLKNQPPAVSLKDFFNVDFHKNFQRNLIQQNRTELFQRDQKQTLSLNQKISENLEWSWMRWLSENIPENSHIFLGNSLPIREWDLCAIRKNKNFIYSASRGANGIDGLASTFLGLCTPLKPNYCILGDLSLLYDLSAPWIIRQLKECSIHFIVINNFGGKIFKDKFQNPYFLNQHKIQFQHFAQMWNLNYQQLKSQKESLIQKSPSLTEIQIP